MLLCSRETHSKTVYIMLTIREEFNKAVKESGMNYEIVQSISGYYRLVRHNDDMTETIVMDDSSCDDVYDEESAMALFIEIIKEKIAYKVYYNDNVNGPVLLGVSASIDEAKAMADREASGHDRVEDRDNVDVPSSASTARIEVYEGGIVTIVDDEPQLNDAVYVTRYFYVE